MNAPIHDIRRDKIHLLADEYSRAGFDVIKEPVPQRLPFDLEFHQPDLVARKGGGGLVVDVRESFSNISVGRMVSVASEVSRHTGWRFLLVTLDDVGGQGIPTTDAELLTWKQIYRCLHEVAMLIGQQALVPALLQLGSAFEAALRRRAIDQSIPVERFPELAMLMHMYRFGEISVDQIDTLEEFLQKCERVAHGANELPDMTSVFKWHASVTAVLSDWKEECLPDIVPV
jgi:hypothetical protein